MKSTQQTLTNSFEQSAEEYITESRLNTIQTKLSKLKIPTPNNSAFNYTNWNKFISNTSGSEALQLREHYPKDSKEYTILSAVAARSLHKTTYITDAFSITILGNPSEDLIQKVHKFTLETLKRYPVTTLLSVWISDIFICDRNTIKEKVGRKTGGFYHPTEHWIAISRDSADIETEYWPVSQQIDSKIYEKSVTIHELGHALHYLFGLQTEGSETVDNRDTTLTESTLIPKQHCIQTSWQYTFVYHCIKAYALLIDGTYESLRFNKYQKKTVEEMFAEGFNAYITAPNYLSTQQPLLYTIFSEYRIQ